MDAVAANSSTAMLQVATEMLIRMEDEEDQAVEEGHRPEATGRREEQQQKHKQKQKQKQKRSKAMDHRPQGEEQKGATTGLCGLYGLGGQISGATWDAPKPP